MWPLSLFCVCTFISRLLRFCQPCLAPSPCFTGVLLLLFAFFSLLYALPSCPWVCMALWLTWHISLDCDALWQKINTSLLVWYGDKTVIILMLCLCGLSFSLIIIVSDVLHWYHCCCSCLRRKELQYVCANIRCSVVVRKTFSFLTNTIDFSVNNTKQYVLFFILAYL